LGTTFFPRDDASKIRAIDLQLLFATVKKIRVSPVHALVDHWLSIRVYKVGDVAICSIVTRLAVKLKLLEGASLDFINTHRQIYGYEHFNHAHLLKKIKSDLYMTNGDAKLRLPNLEMAVYFFQTLDIEFQVRPVNKRGAQGGFLSGHLRGQPLRDLLVNTSQSGLVLTPLMKHRRTPAMMNGRHASATH
jgi:hypothetical protein